MHDSVKICADIRSENDIAPYQFTTVLLILWAVLLIYSLIHTVQEEQ